MLTLQFEDRIEYTFWARADSDINFLIVIPAQSLPQRREVRESRRWEISAFY